MDAPSENPSKTQPILSLSITLWLYNGLDR
jgi:hypothetical protein